MHETQVSFHFPDELSVTRLAQRLSRLAPVRAPSAVNARRQFLDSFDWRLFQAGLELEHLSSAGEGVLRLTERNADRVPVEIAVAQLPRTVADLPPGVLRERLARVLGPRALLSRSDEALRLWRGAVLGDGGKVVARIELCGAPRRRGAVARIRPVRGYRQWVKRLAACLGRDLGGVSWHGDPLLLATSDVRPGPGEHPRWQCAQPIEPSMRTDRAVLGLLSHYSRIMDLNLEGTIEAWDPEFLHDFRIGIRRCRTLLRHTPGVLAPARLATFSKDLQWLGAITGPVRDLDVYALEFPDYVRSLPGLDVVALEPLLAHVGSERVAAHATLAASLNSARFRRRWSAWLRFVNTPAARSPRRPEAKTPVGAYARQRIARAARRVYRAGDAIDGSSPAERYHELRKKCKNLRYLYEAFASLDSGKHLKHVIKALKKVQDVLGEHQDLEVHGAALAGFAAAIDGDLDAATRDGAETLRLELHARSLAARGRFDEAYRELRALRLHKRTLRSRRGVPVATS